MNNGIFITIEGNDGAGKSTAIKKIEQYLISKGRDVLLTREPGGTKCPIAEQIRGVILDVDNTGMDGITEAYLYAASRRQHLFDVVMPALEQGKIVLCDRFIDSSLAYQGYARDIGIDKVYELNKLAVEGNLPKITLLFMVDPAEGLRRINRNPDREINRLDKETGGFHQKVYEGYLAVAKQFSDRVHIVDANRTPEEVFEQAKVYLGKYVGVR